jgi:hypothetical protein
VSEIKAIKRQKDTPLSDFSMIAIQKGINYYLKSRDKD